MFTPQQFKTAILVVISTAFFQATAAVAACSDCGRVASVNAVETEGKASGVGAVAGGVGGALIGNQFGKGGTKTALTVAGAAGGAYAGHQVEKSMSKKKTWQIAVNMDAGSKKTFNFESQPSFKTGDHVKVRDGKLLLLSD